MFPELERAVRYVESEAPRLMRHYRIPGLSIAIVGRKGVLYSEGFGYRDLEKYLPATPSTLYGLGSTTKSFVALSIMQLVEEGKISLDDPASKYIPLQVGFEDEPIRIRHLLSHSSGIPDLGTSTIMLLNGLGLPLGIPLAGLNDFYRFINGAQGEVAARPGERFFYLNAGYRMLGHIIQKVSGLPLHEYIREKILGPLGMHRSTFLKSVFERDPDRITPYRVDEDGRLIPAPHPYPDVQDNPENSFLLAAGGLISSVSELSNYLEMYLNSGVYQGRRIIGRNSLEEMLRIHVEIPGGFYGRRGYGYGWRITEGFFGSKLVSHGGSILVSTSHLSLLPEEGFGVAMAANAAGFPYDEFAQAIYAILLGRDPGDVPPVKVRKKMEILSGHYYTYRRVDSLDVVEKQGMLYIVRKGPLGTVSQPLIPEDPLMETNRFYIYMAGEKQPAEFTIRENGRIDLYLERDVYHKAGPLQEQC